MQNILTEAILRSGMIPEGTEEYTVSEGTIVTASAREYLKKRGIKLKLVPGAAKTFPETMSRTPIKQQANHTYVDAENGRGYEKKPEDMTHLRGNLLVAKNHPRIAFRGKLDSLEADILRCQAMAADSGKNLLCSQLGEVLWHVRQVLGAEVKDMPLTAGALFGYDHDELRDVSHHVKERIGIDHPVPDYRMGRMALELNALRARVREAELSCVAAFAGGQGGRRPDIIEEMNRLSSGVYILFCQEVRDGKT